MGKPTGGVTREAGLRRLQDFAQRAGPLYAKSRNFDFGPERRGNVSMLSPWLRHRLVLEQEVLDAVLQRHSPNAAAKFLEEIFWRAYFKGWLEQHPSVWTSYRRSVSRLLRSLESDAGSLRRYEAAIAGNTGIDCFDAWVDELTTHGYLHNHARMWFASIWVYTLGLPWQLGADFFYRNLMDGDPASNTLGWRWVCGLHTSGKTYLARPANIAHFTDNRFCPEGQLAARAPALSESRTHPVARLSPLEVLPAAGRFGLLVTEEDCNPESLGLDRPPEAVLGAMATNHRSPLPVGESARDFAEGAVRDAMERASRHFASDTALSNSDDWGETLLEWALKHRLQTIATAYAPIGPVAELLADARNKLASNGISLMRLQRLYDGVTWPHSRRGFFRMKQQIPSIINTLGLGEDRDRQKAS
jgi:deoxyribodipyrimidine photo-lyase